jgi:benzoyl-CoA reductase subunit D
LLRQIKADEGITFISGGLACDEGLMAALNESLAQMKLEHTARSHSDSPYAGAIGAALWGAFRHEKLTRSGMLAKYEQLHA